MSKVYDLEPRDPVVLGDGRSIGENTMTGSLDLPFPSTLAGLIRTTLGRKADGQFDKQRIPALLEQSLTGPLLTRLDPTPTLLVPAPADAIFFEHADPKPSVVRRRLSPIELAPGESTDLAPDLQHLGFAGDERGKPKSGPKYWTWAHFESWLGGVDDGEEPPDLGLTRLEHEERVHVAINSDTRTARDGALFRTDGVRYAFKHSGKSNATPLFGRLALRFGWAGADDVPGGVVGLGGERRLSLLTKSSEKFPGPSSKLIDLIANRLIANRRRVRLILLTPAIFDLGFRPTSFAGAKLVACAVGRPVVVSGWDHAKNDGRGEPKATRRCAPAGSVYWLDLEPTVKDVKEWVEGHWFKNISSNEQDRRDGFGLAVVGVG